MKGVALVPSLPNFLTIRFRTEDTIIDVGRLTEDELREVGQRWTNALVAHAAKRRQALR